MYKSHYENVPFEIPESWAWVTLNEVCEVARGGSPRPIKDYLTTNEDGVNWIKIGDTDKDGKYINSTKEKIIPEGVHRSRFVHKGDFLLTNSMSFGRPYILNIDGCIHDGWLVISPFANTYVTEFLYFLLSSSFAYDQFADAASGGVVSNLNSDKVANSYFPLPPEREQRRIINELNNWFKVVGELDKNIQGVKSFVSRIKSKILDHAISGKLVPQDPDDEPAIELLKRINPGFKPCDNSHYENLPQGWVKLRLGDVCSFERGITFPSSAKCTIKQPGMIACIRTANVQDNLELDDLWYVGNEYIKGNTEKLVRKNDIIMSSANSRELVGKVSYVHDLTEQMTFGGFVLNIRANECILPFFLFLMLRTLYLKGYYLTIATQTTNIANLNTKILGDIEVLLPPLTEQERIINSVTNILASIENITVEL